MNIGLFGGTVVPIHRGHTALTRAAQEQFQLGRIYFVPANIPPHKQKRPLASFPSRYAMVALATAENQAFVPSLLEAPADGQKSTQANYSVDTVKRFKQTLKKSDRLFFLIGIDAFREIATWRDPEALSANANSSWPVGRAIRWPMWPMLCLKACVRRHRSPSPFS